jgi:NADPH:quinone reductase-like Zn-dependent oxidoreductase
MRALTYTEYGPPSVVQVSDVPRPVPAEGEVLVRVEASAVNTSDWRIRAAAFPGITALPGRLLYGLWRPRNTRLGSEFAGVIASVGPRVTRFQPGDRVFGMTTGGGASAEYLAVPEDSAIALRPEGLSSQEAAALPFGGLAALVFLTQFGKVAPGQRVLIVGASGGVGAYAVQIAKALGAHVTGIAGPASQGFVARLGADVTLDYTTQDARQMTQRFDVILDTVGAMPPSTPRQLIQGGGVFLPLNMGLRELGSALLNPFCRQKVVLGVNKDTAADLARLSALVQSGAVRPVIDRVFALEEAAAAHAYVEARHRQGALILRVAA